MFKRLLVPLDGSQLAEAVLPAARYLAQTCQAAVTLLHVVEVNAPEQIHASRILLNRRKRSATWRRSRTPFPQRYRLRPMCISMKNATWRRRL